MPKEMRRVVLRDREVSRALQSFVQARDPAFRGARLTEMRVVTAQPLEIEVTVRRAGEDSTFALGAPHVAAALISFCGATGIPLPRIAAKAVKRVNGGIALDMTIDDGADG
ncbi:hypothetical protein [Roseospira goensis]|uniref:Uncharacterized protein n=1 Tax=Roseospira goensis TaxID=391922 RepID=A0A7W6RWQ1_9PROT|nr:hypothetical protein [Roseospira goensis]MBB4284471.1 hypothetical protein [Roseospira goensis]